jgi:hypothetical protein
MLGGPTHQIEARLGCEIALFLMSTAKTLGPRDIFALIGALIGLITYYRNRVFGVLWLQNFSRGGALKPPLDLYWALVPRI